MLSIKNIQTLENKTKNKSIQGFTLIEMAISLMIIGLLVAPFVHIYSNYQDREKIRTTDQNVARSISFIHNYRKSNGRYPCPAAINIPSTNANYGRSVDCQVTSGTATHTPTLVPPGTCLNGICMEQAIPLRLPTLTGDTHVIVGALPYRDLQLEEDVSLDGHGNRILYAVTYSMTDSSTFDDTQGAIAILDQAGNQKVLPAGSVDYLVLSAGETGQGAYSREGVLRMPCTGAGRDIENCNNGFETGTADTDATYVAALRSDGVGTSFYDDTLEYFSQDTPTFWKRGETDKSIIETLTDNNVGVGTTTPADRLTIEAAGAPALRVSGTGGNNGNLLVSKICDSSGGNCFDPDDIGGDNTIAGKGMKCPPGEYMIAIKDAQAECRPPQSVGVECPPATPVLVGVLPNGEPDCIAIPGSKCPHATFTHCPGHPTNPDIVFSPEPDGFRTGLIPVGDCMQKRYECLSGVWTEVETRGSCDVPTTGRDTVTPPCTSVGGYTDGPKTTFTQTTSNQCTPVSGWEENTLLQDCTCVDIVVNDTCPNACPPGMTQTAPFPPRTSVLACDPVTNKHTSWVYIPPTCPDISNFCTCTTPVPSTRFTKIDDCQAGWRSDPNDPRGQNEVWNSSQCRWEPNGPMTGNCICASSGTIKEIVQATGCTACKAAIDGWNEYAIDPSTCLKGSTPIASQAPRCDPKTLSWKIVGSSTAPPSSVNIRVGHPCNCGQLNTGTNCKQGGQVHRCKCLP